MTIKELFECIKFDDVALHIRRTFKNSSLAPFKMAFDGMKNTIPYNGVNEKVIVDFSQQWGLTAHTDNIDWREFVAKEVCVDGNVTASLDEIAAAIMVAGTINGYTPDEIHDFLSACRNKKWWSPPTSNNPYHKQLWYLKQREHDSLCSKVDLGTQVYEHPFPNHPYWLKAMNRSKRKRAHRWKKRIQELRQLTDRWYLLQEIKKSVKDADLSLFEGLLFKAVRCEISRREDFSAEGTGLSYIYELMTKYDLHFSQKADLTLLWIQSSNTEEDVTNDICKLVSQPIVVHQTWQKWTRLTIIQLFE